MDVRFTDQGPGTDVPSPEVPASPAALFEPLAPAVEEPAMTASSVPPTVTTPAAERGSRRWPVFVAIGLLALVMGATIGYFAGSPARNDLRTQRDAATDQVATLSDQLDAAKGELASTSELLATAKDGLASAESDLAKSASALASMTELRDGATATASACTAAATTANDLVAQWRNVFSDLMAWLDTPYGSAADAQMNVHMTEQFTKMDEQQIALDKSMETCLG